MDGELIRYRSQTQSIYRQTTQRRAKCPNYPLDPRAGVDGVLISPPRNAERGGTISNSLNLDLRPTLYGY